MSDLVSALWLRRLIVVALLAGLVILSLRVLQPFIVPLLWAGIIAYVSQPAYRWLLRRLGERRSLSAFVMTFALTLAVIAPTVWLVAVLRIELLGAYRDAAVALSKGFELPDAILRLPWIGDWLRELSERMVNDPRALSDEVRQLIDRSFVEIASIVGGVGRNVLKLVITVVTLFFMYRDGQGFAAQTIDALERLLGARVHAYFEAIGQTVRAVVYGLVLAALAQGTLAGVGYWFAGLEAPVLLAAVTTLCALIPFVVPAVWGSAALWLLATGHTAAGIGLFIWGAAVVSWIDNLIRPLVISNATRIPFLLVMFGVLGGLGAFGLVGLFIGPVILAVLIAVWREWLAESRAA